MDVYENRMAAAWASTIKAITTFEHIDFNLLGGMGFTCMIIDDELLARKRIKKLLEDRAEIILLQECSNGETAVEKIQELRPDFVFLDIKMKDMTGFEVLAQTNPVHMTVPIFVSGFDNFAIKAFEYAGFDFLLKPFDQKRFENCLTRVKNFLAIKSYSNDLSSFVGLMKEINGKLDEFRNKPLDKIPVKLGNKTILIDTEKITYFSASGSYSELYLSDKKMVLRDSLTNIHKSLDRNKFIRIHRSTIINRHFIQEIQASSYYEIDIIMPKNKKFRVSKSYRNEVLKMLGI